MTVLNACIQSEYVLIDWQFAYWLAPDSSRWKGRQRKACEHLASKADLWEDESIPLIDPLLDRKPLAYTHPFLGFFYEGGLAPVLRDVLPIRAVTANDAAELKGELEGFVEERTARWISVGDEEFDLRRAPPTFGPRPADIWLRREGDLEGIDPKMRDACSELADKATQIAPSIVSNE